MKKWFSNISAVSLIVLTTILAGIFRFFEIPVALYPNVQQPQFSVNLGGITSEPDDFYQHYGKEVESSIMKIDGITRVTGSYEQKHAKWSVQFDWNVDTAKAKEDLERSLSSIESTMPKDWNRFNVWEKSDNGKFLAISLYSKKYSDEDLYHLIHEKLSERLVHLDGFRLTEVVRPYRSKIQISVDPDRLLVMGTSIKKVSDALKAKEFDRSLGVVRSAGQRFFVTEAKKDVYLGDIKSTLIDRLGGREVRLSDVAKVELVSRLQHRVFRGNGQEGVTVFAEHMKPGVNLKKVADDFRNTVFDTIHEIDPDIQGVMWADPSVLISKSIRSLVEALLLGISIAVAILFLFFGSFRYTLVITLSIPFSLLGGIILMEILGIELNLVSLGAMALSVGMLVDGSIVVFENICRHFEESHPRDLQEYVDSSWKAVVEVRNAILASLLTTIIVFLPLVFTKPIVNALMGDLSKVVICVLVLSMFTTLFVVPPMMVWLRPNHDNMKGKGGIYRVSTYFTGFLSWLSRIYISGLSRLMDSRKTQLCFATILLACFASCCYLGVYHIEREVIAKPVVDKVFVQASFKKKGAKPEDILPEVKRIEESIETILSDRMKFYFTSFTKHNAIILLVLKDGREMKSAMKSLEEAFVSTPLVNFYVNYWNPGGLRLKDPPLLNFTLQVEEEGLDLKVSQDLWDRLMDVEGIGKKRVHPDLEEQSFVNVTRNSTVIETVQIPKHLVDNMIETISFALRDREVKNFQFHSEDLKVQVGFIDKSVSSVQDMKNLLVSHAGKIVPYRTFLNFSHQMQWKELYTVNGVKNIEFILHLKHSEKNRRAAIKQEALKIIDEFVSSNEGVSVHQYDTQKEIDENIYSLLHALLAAVILIFILVNVQFHSLRLSVLILSVIPFGFMGSILALYLFSSTISVNSMLGMILLVGTVVNNSILFVDFYQQTRKSSPSMDARSLVLHVAKLRMRPILVTTLTTIFGMLPLAIGLDSSGEIVKPLGIAVSCGLGFSTFLTFFFVPVVLYWIDSIDGAKRDLLA